MLCKIVIILVVVFLFFILKSLIPINFTTFSDYSENIEKENYNIIDDTVGYFTASKELLTNDAVMLSEIGEQNYITLFLNFEVVYNFSIENNEVKLDSMTDANNNWLCPSVEVCKEECRFEIWLYTNRAEKLIKDIT